MADLDGHHSVTVEAPRETCIAVLLDAERYPAWYDTLDRVAVEGWDSACRPHVVAITADAGPLGSIGFRLRQSYDLPASIAGEQVDNAGRIVDVTNRWELEPISEGSTRVTYTFSANASGFAARAALRAARPLAERGLIRGFAEALKDEAERR